jgi:hypothetical protein
VSELGAGNSALFLFCNPNTSTRAKRLNIRLTKTAWKKLKKFSEEKSINPHSMTEIATHGIELAIRELEGRA